MLLAVATIILICCWINKEKTSIEKILNLKRGLEEKIEFLQDRTLETNINITVFDKEDDGIGDSR